jgi:hypothetical protein
MQRYVAYVVPIVNVSSVFPKSVSCEEDIDGHRHQVSLRSDILSIASPVVIWSGEAEAGKATQCTNVYKYNP